MKKIFALIVAVVLMGMSMVALAGPASADKGENHKAWVCKYVGKPGENERLKGGKNPIHVATSATEGSWFSDGQNRSFVLDWEGPGDPKVSDCPSPDGGETAPDNKSIDICHDNLDGTFTRHDNLDFDTEFWTEHKSHQGKDVWAERQYYNTDSVLKTLLASGDQSLLKYENCTPPTTDKKIPAPEGDYQDKCETADDKVWIITPEVRHFTVPNPPTYENNVGTVTAVADEGYFFADGPGVSDDGSTFTFTYEFKKNQSCDLPETGGEATYNTVLGGVALAGVVILGGVMLLTRRKRV